MNRRTFVIQVYSDGPTMLENLTTQERVPLCDLAAVGPQIERWLAVRAPDARDGISSQRGSDGSAAEGDGATPA